MLKMPGPLQLLFIAAILSGAIGWATWTTATLIDIRVNVATMQERVTGIEHAINPRVWSK